MTDSFLTLGLILLVGFFVGYGLSKLRIPGLVGMLLVGMLFGPYALQWISPEILSISPMLRKIALVVILTRSGLNLDLESLKRVGRPAILMCFIPATMEILGVTIAGYFLLKITVFEAMLLGSVLAAVSPAVVSPRMIRLIEERFGEEKAIPKLILAGSSVDDIYVIVLFYAFLGLVQNQTMDFVSLLSIPVSITLGIGIGILVGILLVLLLKKTNFKLPIQILIVLSCSFLLVGLENIVANLTKQVEYLHWLQISGLLGIVVLGMVIVFQLPEKAKELSKGYNALWTFFEILLFVLVGATVDLSYAISNFGFALLVLLVGLSFRILGVYLCLLGTNLNLKERAFCIISYMPKATVQASIGGIALAMGLSCGAIVLTVAVISILVTAPLGALLIDNLYKKLLIQAE